MRLFKISWKIPYARYETYVFGSDEVEAIYNFTIEAQKEVWTWDMEGVVELPLEGVVTTKYIKSV